MIIQKESLTQSVERVGRFLQPSLLPTGFCSDLSRSVVCCLAGEVMSMRVYLVWHGEAKSEAEDPERSLTAGGEGETTQISGDTRRLGTLPSKIYHRGKKRVEQIVSKTASNVRPSKAGFKVGDKITVEGLLCAALLKSAHDAAVVLAELVHFIPRKILQTNCQEGSAAFLRGWLSQILFVKLSERRLTRFML